MKQRPILFSTPMVQAILEGRKTQTRRILKHQPHEESKMGFGEFNPALMRKNGDMYPGPDCYGAISEDGEFCLKCPYGKPGDVLWVRETWRRMQNGIDYKSDYPDRINFRWKPSIHMPKAAARIWLEITNVRVERLSEISEQDAFAEGVKYRLEKEEMDPYLDGQFKDYTTGHYNLVSSVSSFQSLWEGINGKSEDDPWVWVIEFKRTEKPKV